MSAAGGTADTTRPTTPANITVSGVTATHLHFGWTKSTDNVGVQGYDLFLDGTKLGTTPFNSADFFSLVCGRTYTLAVVAFDAAGNRSDQGTGTGTTSACAGSPAPAPAPSPTPAPTPAPAPSSAAGVGTTPVAVGLVVHRPFRLRPERLLAVGSVRELRSRLSRGEARPGRANARRLVSRTVHQG